uniref:Uncharacterized protein n=1 Tax=Oryza nivara TaxID=4536 RepID=A0A0E0GGS3_ORYNI
MAKKIGKKPGLKKQRSYSSLQGPVKLGPITCKAKPEFTVSVSGLFENPRGRTHKPVWLIASNFTDNRNMANPEG